MVNINLLSSRISDEVYDHYEKNKKPIIKSVRLTEETWEGLKSLAKYSRSTPSAFLSMFTTELVRAQGKPELLGSQRKRRTA